MFEIEKFRISELTEFVDSPIYNQLQVAPISRQRAISYVNNPRSNPDDFVLYMIRQDNVVLGFRTVLPDNTISGEHFAWMSGSWVKEDMRRHGISSFILKEIVKDWNGKLMYTNYSPASKNLYDKSEHFIEYTNLNGIRFYLRSVFHKVLPIKKSYLKYFVPLLFCFDLMINILKKIVSFFKSKKKSHLSFNSIEKLSDNIIQYILKNDSGNFVGRDRNYLNWVEKYPWLSKSDVKEIPPYPFSSTFDDYEKISFEILNNDSIVGFYQLLIKNKTATMPFYYSDEAYSDEIIQHIFKTLNLKKAESFTTFNQTFIQVLNRNKRSTDEFFRIQQVRKYFATKALHTFLPIPDYSKLQDGDGDTAFV